jgi:hypothetical protein
MLFGGIMLKDINGVSKVKVTPFEDFIYRRLDSVFYNGATGSIVLKYLIPHTSISNNLDLRCILLTMALCNSSIVTGNIEYFKNHGEEIHSCVETFDAVYDPTLLLKFRKKVFYKLFKPSNVISYSHKDYVNSSYLDVFNTSLHDINFDIVKRVSFCSMIPMIEELQIKSHNFNFQRDLSVLKEQVNYSHFYTGYSDINKLILK